MMLTHIERRDHCAKNFWMTGAFYVVVKCGECGRHNEMPYDNVINREGKLTKSKCGSCDTMSCAPVLKDHKTVAEVTL